MPHDTQLTNAQTRDIEALLHPYTNAATHRQVGAHLIDRTGTLSNGMRMRILHPIPAFDPAFRMTIDQVIEHR